MCTCVGVFFPHVGVCVSTCRCICVSRSDSVLSSLLYPCAKDASFVFHGFVVVGDFGVQEDGLPSPPFCSPCFHSSYRSFISNIVSKCFSSRLPLCICVTLMCLYSNLALCSRREDVSFHLMNLVSFYFIVLRCQLLSYKSALQVSVLLHLLSVGTVSLSGYTCCCVCCHCCGPASLHAQPPVTLVCYSCYDPLISEERPERLRSKTLIYSYP